MHKNKQKKLKAFSLVEILIVIGLISIIVYSLASLSIDAIKLSQDRWNSSAAGLKMKEISSVIINKKNNLWKDMLTDSSPKHLVFAGNTYTIANGTDTVNGITYSFQVQNALRDVNGNFVTSGGTVDLNSKLININSTWTDKFGFVNNVTSGFYVTNWNTYSWLQTTTADFNAGTHNNTVTDPAGGGEVKLQTIIYPDWCNPSLTLNQYDLPGSSVSKTVSADPGHAYLGTAGTNVTSAMTKLDISGVNPPTITVDGTFGGYAVNDVFVVGNIAYLATTDNAKEVVIVDISHTPYTEIGYFNATGTTDATSIYVSGTTGYVATGTDVQSFNLTANNGSRAKLGSITLAHNQVFSPDYIAQIYVRGNYLFAALNNDLNELAIANVTNPASMTEVSQASVNNLQTYDLYVSPDGSRAYFGTNYAANQNEFFIMNTSNKSKPTIISSYNTNGMSITGLVIIPADNRAILVGKNGQEYQALNISNENSISKCGGYDINSGIEDIATVTDVQGNAFAYLVTDDNTAEFKILRGGPGGGIGGSGFALSGTYTSSIFDSTSTTASYYTIKMNGVVPAGGSVKTQVRASPNSNMSGSTVWAGPDGTAATYFTGLGGFSMPSVILNNRYFQYKVDFTSNQVATPELYDLTLNYQK